MHKIEVKSAHYPGKHSTKIKAEHYRLCRRVKYAEQESVKRRNHRIDHAPRLWIPFAWDKHRHAPKWQPDIHVRKPPGRKAKIKSVQDNVNVYRYQGLEAEHDRIRNTQSADEMYIRQGLHKQVTEEHYRAEHGEKHTLEYAPVRKVP